MTYDVDAIFNHGVLHPLEPLALPEGARVHLQIQDDQKSVDSTKPVAAEEAARRTAALAEFQRLMAALPIEGIADEFSGADHDRLLYGQP